MLQFLDNLVYYADPTLPSFSSLTYLYLIILFASLLISFRSRQEQEDTTHQ
jgi:hypothetical protein